MKSRKVSLVINQLARQRGFACQGKVNALRELPPQASRLGCAIIAPRRSKWKTVFAVTADAVRLAFMENCT